MYAYISLYTLNYLYASRGEYLVGGVFLFGDSPLAPQHFFSSWRCFSLRGYRAGATISCDFLFVGFPLGDRLLAPQHFFFCFAGVACLFGDSALAPQPDLTLYLAFLFLFGDSALAPQGDVTL